MIIEGKEIELIVATCNAHGEFAVNPANHLAGEGCPVCECSHVARTFIDGFDGPVNIRCPKSVH